MSFVKSISMDKYAQAIWERDFGKGSQKFSSWICKKLRERDIDGLDPETRKKLIQKRKEKTLMELLELEEAEKNANIEIESEEKQNTEKEIQKQKELDKLKREREKEENEKNEKSLELHKRSAMSLFGISNEESEKVCKEYLRDKKEGNNPGSFKKYFENRGFEIKNLHKIDKKSIKIKEGINEI